jgi:hypothetical protein
MRSTSVFCLVVVIFSFLRSDRGRVPPHRRRTAWVDSLAAVVALNQTGRENCAIRFWTLSRLSRSGSFFAKALEILFS